MLCTVIYVVTLMYQESLDLIRKQLCENVQLLSQKKSFQTHLLFFRKFDLVTNAELYSSLKIHKEFVDFCFGMASENIAKMHRI